MLKHFRTVEELRSATPEQIAEVPGLPAKEAEAIYRHLHPADEA